GSEGRKTFMATAPVAVAVTSVRICGGVLRSRRTVIVSKMLSASSGAVGGHRRAGAFGDRCFPSDDLLAIERIEAGKHDDTRPDQHRGVRYVSEGQKTEENRP